MRRWKLTAILAIVAAVSAVFAPRLFGIEAPVPLTEVHPVATHTDRSIPHVQAPDSQEVRAAPRSEAAIPELKPIALPPVRVAVPATPKPVPEEFWIDAVDCGMG